VKKTDWNFEKTNWFGFSFISLKLKKPNRTQTKKTRAKPEKSSQTKKPSQNRVKPVFILKKSN
jgi:hypothetical protein